MVDRQIVVCHMNYFELDVWKKCRSLVKDVYALTQKFPREEAFGLTAQLRRSVISIPSNVAEGWGRHFGADYLRHLQIARGSVCELSTQAEVCKRLRFDGDWNKIMATCDEVGRILNGLISSIQRNLS